MAVDDMAKYKADKKYGKQSFVERTTTPMYKGRMYFRPATLTPQEMGIKSDAQIQREADALDKKNKANAIKQQQSQQQQLMSSLQNMYGSAAGNINSAYLDLASMLGKQVNPYAGMKPETVQATPQLNELLQSQGVSTSPLEQLAAVTQAQNTGQATAYQNLIDTLGGMWNAGQMQQQQNVGTLQQQALQNLAGTTLGYGKSLLGKKSIDQNALLQLINALGGVQ